MLSDSRARTWSTIRGLIQPLDTALSDLVRLFRAGERSVDTFRKSDATPAVSNGKRSIRTKIDPRQRARLERYYLALVVYAINLLASSVCVVAGYVNANALLVAIPPVILANLTIYLLFRSGLNSRFHDPGLATAQMLLATGFTMYAAYIANEARSLFLILYLVPYVFSTSQFRPQKHLLLGVFGLVLYCILCIVHWLTGPEAVNLKFELLQLASFGIVMAWLSFIGHSHKTLRYRAEYDQLTRVRNRQNLLELIEHELNRANRGGPTFCIALMDLDHFKRVNDSLGHAAGDVVLRRFAKTILRSRRQTDIFGRFGGEEFLMLLPGTTLERSILPLERLRARIESMTLDDLRQGMQVTASIGVAEFIPGESVVNLVKRADRKLYEAKRAGRNRIVFDEA